MCRKEISRGLREGNLSQNDMVHVLTLRFWHFSSGWMVIYLLKLTACVVAESCVSLISNPPSSFLCKVGPE